MAIPLETQQHQVANVELHDGFKSLPEDIVRSVLILLGARDLARVGCLNKSFQKLASEDATWERYVRSEWRQWSDRLKESLSKCKETSSQCTFRDLYCWRFQLDRQAEAVVGDMVCPLKRDACETWPVEQGADVMVRAAA